MLLCVGPFTYAPGEGPVVAKRLAQSRKGVCDLCQLDGGPEQTRAAVDVVVVVAICRLVSRAATGRVGFLHCASLRAVLSLADGILRHFLCHPRTRSDSRGSPCQWLFVRTFFCMWRRHIKRTNQAGNRKRNIK